MKITTVVEHFWKWFAQREKTYRKIYTYSEKDMVYLLDELNMHLRAYCKFLEGAVGGDPDTGMGTLIITANGRLRFFKKADKLVAKAPALANWEILSLHPPCPPDSLLKVCFPDINIDPARLWFYPLDEDKLHLKKDIIVFSELYSPDKDFEFDNAVRMIIANILGERSAALNIRAVYLANLSDAPDMEELMRLEELPAYVNYDLSSAFEVSAAGKLQLRE